MKSKQFCTITTRETVHVVTHQQYECEYTHMVYEYSSERGGLNAHTRVYGSLLARLGAL